jgi:hypothetical protein
LLQAFGPAQVMLALGDQHVGRPPVQLGFPVHTISQRSDARAWIPRLHDPLPSQATRQTDPSHTMG